MLYIGIDPGLQGGLACLGAGFPLIPMPVCAGGKPTIDEAALRAWLEERLLGSLADHSGEIRIRAAVEQVGARPGQGVCSMFTFGAGWGLVRGILCGLGIPYILVRPQEWQRVVLAGQPAGSEYAVASRLWPGQTWTATERSRKPHSGMVDAALIAEWLRRTSGK
jgi:crossover junction endodeoxyribonuclease RuvC